MSSLSQELSAFGPLFQVVEKIVTQTTAQATVQLALANPLRWGILISQPVASNQVLVVATQLATIQAGGGTLVGGGSGITAASTANLDYDFRHHGTYVQQTFFGGSQGGGFPSSNLLWTVTEILFVPS